MSERRHSQRPVDAVLENHELESYPTPRQQKPNQSEPNVDYGFTNKTRGSNSSGQHDEDGRDGGATQAQETGPWIVRWWKDNIARAVPVDDDVRDHFALERTFLAYIRTANALASTAIAIYQLSRLSLSTKSSNSGTKPINPRILTLEKAITMMLVFGAFSLTVIGAWRFFTRQKRVEKGKMTAGGFDLWGVGGVFTMVEIMLFVSILLS